MIPIEIDNKTKDVLRIKNERSREMYSWLVDLVETKGPVVSK